MVGNNYTFFEITYFSMNFSSFLFSSNISFCLNIHYQSQVLGPNIDFIGRGNSNFFSGLNHVEKILFTRTSGVVFYK